MCLKKISNLFVVLMIAVTGFSQNKEIINNYIATYKELAIQEMKRTGVPASIKLAQGIHETLAGTSQLVLKSNNHFGIKCKSNWTGESVRHDDDAKAECFRKYPSAADSYRDHSDFLKNSQRYADLFALVPTDYAGWAFGLKKAGYATNPKYPLVLIKLIEDYHLQDYTLLALDRKTNDLDKVVQNTKVVEDTEAAVSVENGRTEEHQRIVDTKIDAQQYPVGIFKINETNVVFVKKGTSFLSLATQYTLPLARLFEFNEIAQQEVSDRDQLIYLQRKRKIGADDEYIVLLEDNMHDIAQRQGIRLESLYELNWLKPFEQPAPGEKLSLKKKAAAMPKLRLQENYTLFNKDEAKANQ